MKFVYFGYDFSINVVHRLTTEGHQLMGLYTFECDNIFSFNNRIKLFALEHGIEAKEGKIQKNDIETFLSQGCKAFISNGYKYKIPPIDETQAYALNVHPALLPRARGIMPMPHILLNDPKAAGITVHKMTQEYDAGDILYQESIPVDHKTDIEVLSCKIALRTPEILSHILTDLPKYWKKAKKQNEKLATLIPEPDNAMRTLDWSKSVEELLCIGKAFGHYGSIARLGPYNFVVYQFNGWEEKHNLEAGIVVCELPYEVVVTASNGFICLKEFQRINS